MKYQSGFTVIVALCAALLGGCNTGEANVGSEPELAAAPLPVEVATPEVADIFATYETTAKIAADAEAPVIARAEGQIVEILVEEGDSVSAGQLLARLDGERTRLQMLQARANLEKATRAYDRQVNLREKGLVSVASLEGLKFDVELLTATYELSKLNYEYTMVRAPIAGVIAARLVKTGAHINSGDQLFAISDTSKLVAYLKIPQTELAKFSAGNRAEVRVDSMDGVAFDATIARISPTIDARNGTFRATAYMNNSGGELAPGMFGRFSIAYEKHSDALLIPRTAVIFEDGENVVYVVQDETAVRRPVSLGIESLGMIEILGGLESDELVIVTGQTGLRDGSKVLAYAPATSLAAG
jgi:membrane fusion protein (multidrug efflux system)